MDYTNLYASYMRSWRKIDPAVLFEILVFAYMNGIYSSRDIERVCKNDIRFMWLLQDEPVPDHSTFARFQNEKLYSYLERLENYNKSLEICGKRKSYSKTDTNVAFI